MSLRTFNLIKICLADFVGHKNNVYSNRIQIKAALDWLCFAQDETRDGGVAAWYSLINGWYFPYIETTGYIIDTFLECAKYLKDDSLMKRATSMANFIVNMQLENGGYRTHPPAKREKSQPTIFNTGQDILGLTSIYRLTKNKKYLDSFIKAADFLCSIQEKSGSWVKFQYGNTSHTYDTRVAWGLLKVWELTNDNKYKRAALKNLAWAANFQLANGWFKKAELPPPNPKVPFTHTISYTMEGFLYSGILLKEERWIKVAQKCANKILDYYQTHDFLPGTFNSNWQSDERYSCLTGDAQISVVWMTLYQLTKDSKYLEATKKLNKFLKSTQDIKTSNKNIKGAIKGSLPIYGDLVQITGYCRMAYPNWGTKFFIDALLLELQLEDK